MWIATSRQKFNWNIQWLPRKYQSRTESKKSFFKFPKQSGNPYLPKETNLIPLVSKIFQYIEEPQQIANNPFGFNEKQVNINVEQIQRKPFLNLPTNQDNPFFPKVTNLIPKIEDWRTWEWRNQRVTKSL